TNTAPRICNLMANGEGCFLSAMEIEGNQFIFGDRFSSIDVVLAVLFARLTMINETSLIDRQDLQNWWGRVQLRGSLRVADLWMRMQRRRLLLTAWKARNTVIN
ncbi:MAG: glutathione S-transferase domain-containing protein, partial [Synechococcus sp. LacPavin_0920_WC12_MAG_50_7]|nr:glutathione S-transferase domain-containing protein [Synechococcus sp. LacPavin_0920_WC12_MAG_50_7]